MSNILLYENPNRFVPYPIKHDDIWELYQKQREAVWWDTDVIITSQDKADWEALTDNERYFLEHVLAFFATADGIVMENLAERFMAEVQLPEARCAYTIQMLIEMVHSLVYAKLLDGYVASEPRKQELIRAIQTVPAIKRKADWAMEWICDEKSFAERLVAFACVEGIFFSGAFCAIFWLRERGVLPALTFSNNLIARDEGMHVEAAVLYYTKYTERLSDERVHEIILGALEPERDFILSALPCDLLGMNSKMMGEYINYVANRLCIQLGHTPLFSEPLRQPFPFMDRICMDVKENFFESRVSNYRMAVVDVDPDALDFDADF